MFASHPDSRSAFSGWGQFLGQSGRSRGELVERRGAAETRRSPNSLNPGSQSLSVRPARHRQHAGHYVVTDDEVRAQAWLDERLAAFYDAKHGLWPRVRRFFVAKH
jgi:hypothetical protein